MTNLVDYTARFLNTGDALDYTPDELDDLTDRKVEAVEFDGDALARIVRARRGAARATGQADPYDVETVVQDTARALWRSGLGTDLGSTVGNRRMAAVGGTGGHGMIEETYVAGGDHVFAWTPGDGNARFVRRG